MTELVKIHKRKLVVGLIILALFIGFKLLGAQKDQPLEPSAVAEDKGPNQKEASTVVFGNWLPTEYRTVLGQVESDSDVSVRAELNGTIARVNVRVGDQVRAGQALASFKTSGDPTAINYQSALSSLEVTKLSSQNSIRSAEVSLENAKKALAQTRSQQDQTYDQAYETLRVEALNADTLMQTALDTLDQMVQFTNKHSFNQSFAFAQIGNTDTILRQTAKTQGRDARFKYQALQAIPLGSSDDFIRQQASARAQLLTDLQTVYTNLRNLLRRGTVANSQISEAQLDGFISQAEGIADGINQRLASLQSRIDTAKGAREQTRLAIINAQNQVESAQTGLELARAQAETQVIGAQNQVNLAGASTADLVVRTPISGTITAKSVSVGDLVNPGQDLFTVVNEGEDKKVVAFLNQDELRQAAVAERIEIEIDGQVVEASKTFLSSQLDVQTQKILAEFTIPAATTLVGNLATVRIPIGGQSSSSNLLPFSAVSFEPDGAEVLVLGENRIAERRKVVVGRVVVSNIEVVSGLAADDEVVEFYKRVLPGEIVLSSAMVETIEALKDFTTASGFALPDDVPVTIVEPTPEQEARVKKLFEDPVSDKNNLEPTNE